jgi:hypothetical protein
MAARRLIPPFSLALPWPGWRGPCSEEEGGAAGRWARTFFLCLALVLASAARGLAGEGQSIPPSATTQETHAPLEDAERRLGPFRIGAQDFTVVLHLKRVAQVRPDRPEESALSGLAIQDASGAILHQEMFSYALEAGAFSESCMASAQLLKGGFATGLLIGVACWPSAPSSGEVWELFGLLNGKLSRLGKPFTTDGAFLGLIPNPPQKRGRATLFLPDVMHFRVWTGNFHVTVPVRVDWMQGRLMPGQRCFEQTGNGLRESGCEVPVEVERVPSDQDLTFVRLFAEASAGMGVPRHIVVRKDSRVEILGAKIKLSWDASHEVIFFGVDDQDPWLKVSIDGQEGWIHTQEDFDAVGVPQAG